MSFATRIRGIYCLFDSVGFSFRKLGFFFSSILSTMLLSYSKVHLFSKLKSPLMVQATILETWIVSRLLSIATTTEVSQKKLHGSSNHFSGIWLIFAVVSPHLSS